MIKSEKQVTRPLIYPMKQESQNAAIAAKIGWTNFTTDAHKAFPQGLPSWKSPIPNVFGVPPGETNLRFVPHFTLDLDAMRHAEEALAFQEQALYVEYLLRICNATVGQHPDLWRWEEIGRAIHASAAQRAECFIRAIGAWVDES